MSRHRIETVLIELDRLGLENFINQYQLHVCFHTTDPICILNYIRVNKRCPITNLCRGLIVTTQRPYQIVSRGFDRFYSQDQTQCVAVATPSVAVADAAEAMSIVRATIKEDGSLIFMFRYRNRWLLSTMHNFADDYLPYNETLRYDQLFRDIIGQDLKDFGDSLYKQYREECPLTFCFEMCSNYNQVIRQYRPSRLYLLAAFGQNNGTVEINIRRELPLPENVITLTVVLNINTLLEARTIVKRLSLDDDTFEGLVVETSKGVRLKVKNPHYLIYHRFKYRGWIAANLALLGPLILNNEIDRIVQTLESSIQGISLKTIAYIKERVTKAREWMLQEYQSVASVIDCLRNEKNLTRQETYQILYTKPEFSNLDPMHKKYIIQSLQLPQPIDFDCFQTYLSNFFSKSKSPILTSDLGLDCHPSYSCYLDRTNSGNYSTVVQAQAQAEAQAETQAETEPRDGLAREKNVCYCGQVMVVRRLRKDLLRYRVCHCGLKYGILVYRSGTLLGVCQDEDCECTHEVNQKTGELLGISASLKCKELRLTIHEIMNCLQRQPNSKFQTKQELYREIERILGRGDVHMATMGFNDCLKVVTELQKHLNLSKF